jgi:hypothetical protein
LTAILFETLLPTQSGVLNGVSYNFAGQCRLYQRPNLVDCERHMCILFNALSGISSIQATQCRCRCSSILHVGGKVTTWQRQRSVPADLANHSRGPQSHTWLGLGLGYHWRRRGARARNCLMELLVFRHAGRGVGLCEQKCRRDFVYRAFFLLTPEEIHASTCPTITQIGCFLKFRVPLTKRFAEMPRSRQAHRQYSKTNNIPEQANLSA